MMHDRFGIPRTRARTGTAKPALLSGLAALSRRFTRDRSANVAIIFCALAVPLVFGTGAGLDYMNASRQRKTINAIADAAALLTVNSTMMSQPASAAQAAAIAFFDGQIQTLSGVMLSAPVSIQVTDSSDASGTVRNTVVSYQAQSQAAFNGVLGRNSLSIGGSSKASSSAPANQDFYLLLDTSPSMAIAATQDGINTMVANTQSQGGCAFACHQTNPSKDGLSVDNYTIARQNNVVLRMDLVVKAAHDLAVTAQQVATQNHVQFRMGIWTFDVQFHQVLGITSDLDAARNAADTVSMLTVSSNGFLTANNKNNDVDTSWTAAMTSASQLMPVAGSGTNSANDSPRETLFIVTDGVADESNGGRQIYAMGGDGCTSLKAKGVRIAILYTYYNPLPQNPFYNAHVAPFQQNIGPTLQACASDGLYSVVNTGGDISVALEALFRRAITQPHLTQ